MNFKCATVFKLNSYECFPHIFVSNKKYFMLSQDFRQATTSHLQRFFHIWETRIQSYKTIWKKIFRPHVKHEPQVNKAHSGIVLGTLTDKHMRKCGQWFGSVRSREENFIFSCATLEYCDQHMDARGCVGGNLVYWQRLPTPAAECFHFRINFWHSLHSQSVTSYLISSRSQVSRLHQCARKSNQKAIAETIKKTRK